MSTLPDADVRAYQANIWKAYLFQLLFSFQLWWPIWVLYLTDLRGFSLTQVSGLEALFWVVIVVGEVPTGAVADRFGRKTSLILCAAFTTAAILVFGLATNYAVVLASYVAWGIGVTFHSGAESALVFESLKAIGREREYQRVAGVTWGLFSLGMLGGLLAGAPLAAVTDLSFPILLSAGIAFLSLVVAVTMKEPELEEGETRLAYRRLVGASARTAWSSPAVRSMLLLSAILLAVSNPIIVFSQPFLALHDVPTSILGIAQAPMRLAGIFGAVAAYRISAALGLRATMIVAPAVTVASFALLGGWNSVYAFGATTSIVLVQSVTMPVTADYLNQRIPNAQRATILSMRQLITSVMIAAFQPWLGVIADEVSLRAVFWASAAFVAAAAPLALALWLRADGEETEPSPAMAEAGPGG